MLPACAWHHLTFISRIGFSTRTLAYMLDSLVRVSRRVGKNHFGKIAQSTLRPYFRQHTHTARRIKPGVEAFAAARPHFASRRSSKPPLPQVPTSSLIQYCQPAMVRQLTIELRRRINFYRFLLNDFKSFNSLFKVLFIFPSQYLFAIGFP